MEQVTFLIATTSFTCKLCGSSAVTVTVVEATLTVAKNLGFRLKLKSLLLRVVLVKSVSVLTPVALLS